MNDVIEETRKIILIMRLKNEKERNIGHYMLEWIRMFEVCIELI